MKKIYSIISMVLLTISLNAQAPQKMSYQAVIRGSNNALVVEKMIGLKISVLQGSESGTAVYTETHTPTTNSNGLAILSIGAGKNLLGNFTKIDWSKGPYFIKTETDVNGGSNYQLVSVSELMSVPYALYSGNSLPSGGTDGQSLTICNGVPTWTTEGKCPGKIKFLSCNSIKVNGILNVGVESVNNSFMIDYEGGDGGFYNMQTINSTGVLGLTATLQAGSFVSGNSNLLFTIKGKPSTIGDANFLLNISGQICNVSIPVLQSTNTTVKTLVNDTTQSPFLCGGSVSAFNEVISERGILYGKTQNLDYNTATSVGTFQYGLSQGGSVTSFQTAKITSLSGVGDFKVNIMYLFENTDYYYCAYAKTESGKIVKGETYKIPFRSFKRDTRSPDVANVFWKTTFSLFDLLTDELILPDANGVYKFYYSSNENPVVLYKELTSAQLPNFLFYKFKNKENCQKWTEIKKGILKP